MAARERVPSRQPIEEKTEAGLVTAEMQKNKALLPKSRAENAPQSDTARPQEKRGQTNGRQVS
jgi:hypothetical protein